MADKSARQIIDEFAVMVDARSNWETHWQLISDVICPAHEFTGRRTPGEQSRTRLYDSTAADAAERLSAAMHSLSTSPTSRWLELHAVDDELDKERDVRVWLREVTDLILKTFNSPRLGFNPNVAEVYSDLVVFGTGCMFIKPEFDSGMFVSRPLSEVFIQENDDKNVDTVYRSVMLNAHQAMLKFGPDAVGDKVSRLALAGGSQARKMRKYVHAVYPREESNLDIPIPANMPWASIHVDTEEKIIVRISGFMDSPYVTPRWRKFSGEVYGRGPGMVALADSLMINSLQRVSLSAAEKAMDPPMTVPYEGFISPLQTQPGGINYVQPGTRDRPQPLFSGADFRVGELQLEKREEKIRLMFFQDLLSLPMRDRMTAEEVSARRSDRMQLLSPVTSRLQSEMLGPIVTRVYGMLARSGRLPEAPEDVDGEQIQIEYTSPMAQAQRSSEAAGIQQAVNLLAPFAQVDPTIMDRIDRDAVAEKAWLMFNNDPRLLRPKDEVQEERQQRQAAAQAAQAGEAAGPLLEAAGRAQQLGLTG